jgi:hypothetical protein
LCGWRPFERVARPVVEQRAPRWPPWAALHQLAAATSCGAARRIGERAPAPGALSEAAVSFSTASTGALAKSLQLQNDFTSCMAVCGQLHYSSPMPRPAAGTNRPLRVYGQTRVVKPHGCMRCRRDRTSGDRPRAMATASKPDQDCAFHLRPLPWKRLLELRARGQPSHMQPLLQPRATAGAAMHRQPAGNVVCRRAGSLICL